MEMKMVYNNITPAVTKWYLGDTQFLDSWHIYTKNTISKLQVEDSWQFLWWYFQKSSFSDDEIQQAKTQ